MRHDVQWEDVVYNHMKNIRNDIDDNKTQIQTHTHKHVIIRHPPAANSSKLYVNGVVPKAQKLKPKEYKKLFTYILFIYFCFKFKPKKKEKPHKN